MTAPEPPADAGAAPLPHCAGFHEFVGGPWVAFYGPDYRGAPGPGWYFEAPGLPAISANGARLLVSENDAESGGPANLRLSTLQLANEAVLASRWVIAPEVLRSAAADDERARFSAYRSLRLRVITGLEQVNAELTAEGWRTLLPCCQRSPHSAGI
jgi:hypothetical protein